MFAKAYTATTQAFSAESTFSAFMSGYVKTIETIYNFYNNNLDYKTKSGLKTFNQLRNQVKENTITREASSEMYIPQYFKTKIQKPVIALK